MKYINSYDRNVVLEWARLAAAELNRRYLWVMGDLAP